MADELVGRKIVSMRKMTPKEMRAEGWDGTPPIVLVLEDGCRIYASHDAEGNGPGVLFGQTKDGRTIAFFGVDLG